MKKEILFSFSGIKYLYIWLFASALMEIFAGNMSSEDTHFHFINSITFLSHCIFLIQSTGVHIWIRLYKMSHDFVLKKFIQGPVNSPWLII